MTERLFLAISVLIAVGAMTLPAAGLTRHPDWNRIEWIPFHDPTASAADLLANVFLFLPLGLFMQKVARWALWKTVLVGVALSFFGEFYQVFCVDRHPDSTDILTNTIGALIGATFAGSVHWRAARTPATGTTRR